MENADELFRRDGVGGARNGSRGEGLFNCASYVYILFMVCRTKVSLEKICVEFLVLCDVLLWFTKNSVATPAG